MPKTYTLTSDPKHIPLLRRAYDIAYIDSDDIDTKNGAVIVAKNGGRTTGANRLPYGVKNIPERLHRPMKYEFVEHAERDAIYYAAYSGISLADATLYCPWVACTNCARAIIGAGITKVVGHQAMMNRTPPRWKENISIAHTMLDEAGVELTFFDGKIGGVEALFDGKKWSP